MGVENHKQDRSLEGGLLTQEMDDDLALFNELQACERENFLLQSSDEFEDIFCKLIYSYLDFSKCALEI